MSRREQPGKVERPSDGDKRQGSPGSRRCWAAAFAAPFGRKPYGATSCRARLPRHRPQPGPAVMPDAAPHEQGQEAIVGVSLRRTRRSSSSSVGAVWNEQGRSSTGPHTVGQRPHDLGVVGELGPDLGERGCQREVHQVRGAVAGQHDVRRGEVPVDHPPAVHPRDRPGQPRRQRGQVSRGNRLASYLARAASMTQPAGLTGFVSLVADPGLSASRGHGGWRRPRGPTWPGIRRWDCQRSGRRSLLPRMRRS